MPKASAIQANFNSGEFSPLLYGRVDFDAYKNALAMCLNQIPLVQGGLARRPGTYFAAEVKDSTKSTRAVRFEFSTTQAYIIEFGDLYMRFYRNNGPVLETAVNITAATAANPVVITAAGHGFSVDNDVEIASVGGMVQLNGRRFRVAATTANTFALKDLGGTDVDGSAFTAYTAGGTASRVYTLVTTYAAADLFQLKFTQSADVLYVAHPSYAQRKITRTAHTSWSINAISFLDGPYLIANSTATTFTCAATSGASVNVTASAVAGINGDTGFQTTDVGRPVRIKVSATNWGWGAIVARTSTTQIAVTFTAAVGGTSATTNWRLGVWSDTTGYPGAVAFKEDRLTWGGSTGSPQRIDFSKTGDYENMAPSALDGAIADDNAISVTLNSNDVQFIRWMIDDEKGLLVGTVRGEWVVRPSNQNEALSPTNVKASLSTTHGSKNIQCVRAGKAVLYVQRAGRKVRELAYVYDVDGYRSPDMTVLAQHITRGGIVEISYQQEPQSLVWAVRADGTLLGFTYEREQKVLGWHRHVLGGFSDSGHTADPMVESVACIPSADGTRDELWVIVKRYVNGRAVRYVEYLTQMWERDVVEQEDAFFADCGLTYDGTPVTTIRGLYHLAGETVQVLADGAAHVNCTVSSTGSITLARSSSVVQVGYAYNSDGQALRPEAGAADGTAQGKSQRSHRVVFRLHDTLGLQIGSNFNSSGTGKLTELTFRKSSDDTSTAVPLFSGDKGETWEGDYTSENYVCWRNSSLFPQTILAIMPQLHTQDDGKATR